MSSTQNQSHEIDSNPVTVSKLRPDRFYMLAFDMPEAVTVAKSKGVHYSKVVFIRNAQQLACMNGLTLVVCPRFHERMDASQIIEAARFRKCEVISIEKFQP